ncbi:aminoglycoside phosphotransferase family protein [Streptomyces sp. NPDC090109]|uniref:aminoglycoside phosphotransferase family protein n=1 Tax=unclassified Streptomyces TaxID=2593676 RepID=UPI001367CE20|nr:aminoglycoside phosphotransferase family protein [Streptomyces sp. SID5770]MZE50459.1 phosphotransferase [Streptomyces sp. SID5770]
MTPAPSEAWTSRVTFLLRDAFGIVPVAVETGPAGTDTLNFVVTGDDGRRWFVKTSPHGADVSEAEGAAALAAYAGRCGVPVAAARPTVGGDRFVAAHRGTAVSVTEYVPEAVTADGRLDGGLWEEVGDVVGRLHHGLARHAFGPPGLGPRDKTVDLARNPARLADLVRRYEAAPPATEFERWAVRTAREKLARLPEVERLLEKVPPRMLTQLVHGDLSGPNLLLKDRRVAALIDFRPPGRRGPVWELGRLALDPRTVLSQPDWPDGLGRLAAAYHARYPAVGVEELVCVARVAAVALALSVYPLNTVVAGLGPATDSLESYARDRHRAAAVLRERLDEAEELLREHLRPTAPAGGPR